MDVLNVSIINSEGDVCLNDELLLELIQEHPFLYNSLVHGYGDADYSEWAWSRIVVAFNKKYENVTGPGGAAVNYTQAELQRRWFTLQPVIKGLSTVINADDIPNSLWQSIVRINVQLEKSMGIQRPIEYTNAQQIVHANIMNVSKLPLERRKCLEAEIMDLILSSEILSKGTVELSESLIQQADEECEKFMRGINEVPNIEKSPSSRGQQLQTSLLKVNRVPTMNLLEEIKQKTTTKDKPTTFGAKPAQLVTAEVSGDKVAEQFILPANNGEVKEESASALSVAAAHSKSKASTTPTVVRKPQPPIAKPSGAVIKSEAPPPAVTKSHAPKLPAAVRRSKASPTPPVVRKSQPPLSKPSGGVVKSEAPKLPPADSKSKALPAVRKSQTPPRVLRYKQFVPLRHAHLYIKRCRVLLARCDADENIPVSKIKRERN